MSERIIAGGTVFAAEGPVADGAVAIRDGKIIWVGPEAALPAAPAERPLAAWPRFDAGGGHIVPGFVDVHIHGGGGGDVMQATPEGLLTMARAHAKHGTTAFLASTATAPHDALVAAAQNVRRVMDEPTGGARVIGLHLEGPYINPKRVGAQNPAFVRDPNLGELREFAAILGDGFKRITIAPEQPGAPAAIAWLAERGVGVSLGHTAATYEEARRGVDAGARYATHTYNAMSPLHHREPGVVGLALSDERVTCELIADTIHVHPAAMQALWAAKGEGRVALITDAIMAMGRPDGVYDFGGLRIHVKAGSARLDDGVTLAGSVLDMATAIRNSVACGVSLERAVRAASEVPAQAAGAGHRKGRLAPGYDADIAVLDADLRCTATWVAGEQVHSA